MKLLHKSLYNGLLMTLDSKGRFSLCSNFHIPRHGISPFVPQVERSISVHVFWFILGRRRRGRFLGFAEEQEHSSDGTSRRHERSHSSGAVEGHGREKERNSNEIRWTGH